MGILMNIPLWCVYGILFGVPSVKWGTGAVWSPDVQQFNINQDLFYYGADLGPIAVDIGIWPANLFAKFSFLKVTCRYFIVWGHCFENREHNFDQYDTKTLTPEAGISDRDK